MIEDAGWRLERITGSHYIYKHPERTGSVVVPVHGRNRDLAPGTALAILKAAGLR
jgi:predicted RNA binding protein YcfA (HicA-like mRNA interferase family)